MYRKHNPRSSNLLSLNTERHRLLRGYSRSLEFAILPDDISRPYSEVKPVNYRSRMMPGNGNHMHLLHSLPAVLCSWLLPTPVFPTSIIHPTPSWKLHLPTLLNSPGWFFSWITRSLSDPPLALGCVGYPGAIQILPRLQRSFRGYTDLPRLQRSVRGSG